MDLGERIARRAIVGFEGEIEDTRYKVHGRSKVWKRLRKPGRRRRIGEILDAEHDYRLYRCHKETGPIGEAFTNVYHTCIPLQQVRLPRLFAYMTGTRVPDKGRYGVHTNYVV